MLTRGLVWAALALFVYVLLTRLRTLAVLAGARRGLREAAAVRIRTSRIAVETLVVVAILGPWAFSTWKRGYLDWDVEGAGSLHVKLAGVWFVVGAVVLTASVTLVLLVTALMAFLRAADLCDRFPRSTARPPRVLRLAVMNPGVVFVAPRRSPLVWAWTEVRAAAFGIVTTLALEAVGHELPVAGATLRETVGDAADEFELEERLGGSGGALTWNELLVLLATTTGAAPTEPDRLALPPADVPFGSRALGYWAGAFAGMLASRRTARVRAMLARFDERAHITAILERTPGPMASVYLREGVDGLLYEARGGVFDSLKPRLSRRHARQLARAYRRDDMDGAAAWMIEKIANYPELFDHSVHAELHRQTSLIDSIVALTPARTDSRSRAR